MTGVGLQPGLGTISIHAASSSKSALLASIPHSDAQPAEFPMK